jgi:acetyl-CoA synthetase
MPAQTNNYDELVRNFHWRIPSLYNIGVDACDRHADGSGRLALIYVDEDRRSRNYTFDDLRSLSNRFANVLLAHGLARGDRVGVLLPQMPETAISHLAAFKAALISIPLFTLFGEEALEHRLANSRAKAVVTDAAGAGKLLAIVDRLPHLLRIYVAGEDHKQQASGNDMVVSFNEAVRNASDRFSPIATSSEDPALIIYTSGTTGNPKGALHAHRVLLGHLPGVELTHNFLPQRGDLCWTPADWAWIGGLLDVLLPAWHHGIPVLAHRARKFDPEAAMVLMAEHGVRNVFLPPTALKLMRQANVRNRGVTLRTLASGGESLGEELLDWGRETFGLTINEFYGQTECNLVVGNNASVFPMRTGSMGKVVPGHDVRIVNEAGVELPPGQAGQIGIRRPDPVMFLEYWQDPEATQRKYAGNYLLTGDIASQDESGYFQFAGRSDDLITSGAYRIGPGEIENCLLKHPAVAVAAVVGVPDTIRTERVKAWLVLRPGYLPSDDLARELQDFVRVRLGAHEYPREVAFAESLPMTTTGKIIRRELRGRG